MAFEGANLSVPQNFPNLVNLTLLFVLEVIYLILKPKSIIYVLHFYLFFLT